MTSEFDIRLKAFNRALGMLDLPENVTLWKDRAPLMFTVKKEEAVLMVAALTEASQRQEAGLGGLTQEKDREEGELEDAAYMVGQALALWFKDHQQESGAGEVDLTRSEWKLMRDQRLLSKSQRVIDLTAAVTGGPEAVEAAKYGLTPEALTLLIKERADYDHIVSAPGVAQSLRRALTKGFRPAFNLVEAKFKELDMLMIQFGGTAAGRVLTAAWKDARLKKGAGGGIPETAKAPVPGAVPAGPPAAEAG